MKPKLKPLDQQVMVITGGTSGIGLATARRAADMGSRLVLAAATRRPWPRSRRIWKGSAARWSM
jgi:NAD(P)-dependent dehydrogenase (short-subunit alcohol dehydrogenase family)